jgi:hypothetical protein
MIRKSIWIPRIPRTGSTYIINKLRLSAIEHDWVLYKKDHEHTDNVYSKLKDENCILVGHHAYYDERFRNWTKILVVRNDVIGRFMSSFNYSNYLLTINNKETVDIEQFIRFHEQWLSEESQELVKKNKGCWNPFTDTISYLNHIQTIYDRPFIENVYNLFDKIYYTHELSNLLYDINHEYGYDLTTVGDFSFDPIASKNSAYEFFNITPVAIDDLTLEQLDRIYNLAVVRREYQFIELLNSKRAKND